MRIYIILTLRENEIVLAIINLATFAIEVPVTNFTNVVETEVALNIIKI